MATARPNVAAVAGIKSWPPFVPHTLSSLSFFPSTAMISFAKGYLKPSHLCLRLECPEQVHEERVAHGGHDDLLLPGVVNHVGLDEQILGHDLHGVDRACISPGVGMKIDGLRSSVLDES